MNITNGNGKFENIEVGSKFELENGYIATVTQLVEYEADEEIQPHYEAFQATVEARSGLITEDYNFKGYPRFFKGFTISKML